MFSLVGKVQQNPAFGGKQNTNVRIRRTQPGTLKKNYMDVDAVA